MLGADGIKMKTKSLQKHRDGWGDQHKNRPFRSGEVVLHQSLCAEHYGNPMQGAAWVQAREGVKKCFLGMMSELNLKECIRRGLSGDVGLRA